MAKFWPTPRAQDGLKMGQESLGDKQILAGSSPEGSPVKTFLLPERERDYRERGLVFGGNITDSLASFDRDTQSWRTSERSLFGGLMLFSDRWPISGLMRSGTAYERQTLVLRTEESESGLLPTPEASNTKAVALRSNGRPPRDFTKMFPTPHANASTGAGAHGDGGLNLQTVVQKFPTPDANVWKGGVRRGQLTDPKYGVKETGGQLNPDWVDLLMMYPRGWTDLGNTEYRVSLLESSDGLTDCGDSATRSCQESHS